MPEEERASPVVVAQVPSAGMRAPRWRALLEARWQARLQEVTELSLAYHGAAALPAVRGRGGPGPRPAGAGRA